MPRYHQFESDEMSFEEREEGWEEDMVRVEFTPEEAEAVARACESWCWEFTGAAPEEEIAMVEKLARRIREKQSDAPL